MAKAIDLQSYFPFFVGAIANRWTSTSSRLYLQRFGIGIGEWRVLAAMQALKRASSNQIVDLVAMGRIALRRERALLGALTPLERKRLILLMRKVLGRLDHL